MRDRQYIINNDGSFSATGDTIKKLDSGFYNIEIPYGQPLKFIKNIPHTDDLIFFENNVIDKIIKDINSFWDKKEIFQQNGFLHRRGVLIHGKNGSGKTYVVNFLMNYLIKNEGIVINADDKPEHIIEAISTIREIEPERNIICLFEDIDEIINKFGENKVLSLLDGSRATNYVLNIATTNYMEKLPKRMKSRPRRFDRIIKIDYPDDSIRRQFFKAKLPYKDEEIEDIVKKTAGFSMAALTEVVISLLYYDKTLEETCMILDSQLNFKDTYEEYGPNNTINGFK